MKIVVDTNIFISALIKDSIAREIIMKPDYIFQFPDFEFQEIYKYKEDILKKAGYSEIEVIKMISFLLKNMRIISYEEICNYYNRAFQIMNEIDPDDIIFIATALAFDAVTWSDDFNFKKQTKIKVFSTEEMKTFQD